MEWQVSPSLDYEPPVNCKRKRDSPADAPPDSECDTYAKGIERLDLGSPHLPLRLTCPRRMKEIAIRKLLERKASHIFNVIERAARELYGRSLGDIRNHGVLEQQLLASCAALQTAPSSLSCKAAFSLISPFYAAVGAGAARDQRNERARGRGGGYAECSTGRATCMVSLRLS
eukprot:EC725812.1.p1 GENE.EC725812.1~~EC725812.1.p1  ORF type:complete len:173 (+),score=19.92 EC725812.1:79-597(+)